jgi:hypothetical protein
MALARAGPTDQHDVVRVVGEGRVASVHELAIHRRDLEVEARPGRDAPGTLRACIWWLTERDRAIRALGLQQVFDQPARGVQPRVRSLLPPDRPKRRPCREGEAV